MFRTPLVFLLILSSNTVFGHSGGLDRNGGHNGPSGYHYHSGSSAPVILYKRTMTRSVSGSSVVKLQPYAQYELHTENARFVATKIEPRNNGVLDIVETDGGTVSIPFGDITHMNPLIDPYQPRTWYSGEHRVVATLAGVEDDEVELFTISGRNVMVPISKLSEHDKHFISSAEMFLDNEAQIGMVDPLVRNVLSNPGAAKVVSAALCDIHRKHPTTVLAGFYGSAIAASIVGESNDHLMKSTRICTEVIARLKKMHASSPGPVVHTLQAALNNKAIMVLRQGNASAAAMLLLEAAELSEETPYSTYLNAQLLSKVSSMPRTVLKVGAKQQIALQELLARSSERTNAVSTARFCYSIRHDMFDGLPLADVDRADTSEDIGLLYDYNCMDCAGDGFYDCAYCAGGTVSVKSRVQVAVNQLNGSPIYGTKSNTVACKNCSGKGGFKCQSCSGRGAILGSGNVELRHREAGLGNLAGGGLIRELATLSQSFFRAYDLDTIEAKVLEILNLEGVELNSVDQIEIVPETLSSSGGALKVRIKFDVARNVSLSSTAILVEDTYAYGNLEFRKGIDEIKIRLRPVN